MRMARPLCSLLLVILVAVVALIGAGRASTRARHHAVAPSAASTTTTAAVKAVLPAPSSRAPVQVAAVVTAKPMEAGMRAYLNPETGTIGAPAPGQNIPPSSATTDEPTLHEVTLPDGSVMVDLQGTLQDYMILQIDAKGRKVMRCVPDPTEALKSTPAPAEPAKE